MGYGQSSVALSRPPSLRFTPQGMGWRLPPILFFKCLVRYIEKNLKVGANYLETCGSKELHCLSPTTQSLPIH